MAMAFTFSCKNKMSKPISTGKLINGRKEGLWKIYDENGILREYNSYKNDTLNGPQITFDKNGKIYTKAHRKMGIFVDSFLLYYDNGQISNESWFNSSGRQQGVYKMYHNNGQLKAIGYSVNGENEGRVKGYDENGHLEYVEYCKSKLKERSVTYFNEKGIGLKIEYYKNDSLYKQIWLNGR
jgi:antitoxin component YwqK of YwqJK toxin-antitoxin module